MQGPAHNLKKWPPRSVVLRERAKIEPLTLPRPTGQDGPNVRSNQYVPVQAGEL